MERKIGSHETTYCKRVCNIDFDRFFSTYRQIKKIVHSIPNDLIFVGEKIKSDKPA